MTVGWALLKDLSKSNHMAEEEIGPKLRDMRELLVSLVMYLEIQVACESGNSR
jgi:hypothetical protein